MKILFVTSYKPVATKGGTERATISTAKALSRFGGHCCHAAYFTDEDAPIDGCFEGSLDLKGARYADAAATIAAYCLERKVDVVVNQGIFDLQHPLRECTPPGILLFFCHHYRPGWEESFTRLGSVLASVREATSLRKKVKGAVKLVFYPAFRARCLAGLRRGYLEAYESSDMVVLLSPLFEEGFKKFGGIEGGSKFRFIPNPLTYRPQPVVDFASKEHVVLIVARLDEKQKRISLALDIWAAVKRHPEAEGWGLRIVGHGRDGESYRRKVEREGIPDVAFLGRTAPDAEYARASVFMMTSASEGWGITLTEAQQFGVVPVAFESYESLHEIIRDGENGFVVPEEDFEGYVKRMIELMSDFELRRALAHRSVASTARFSDELIAQKWEETFREAAICR